MLEKRETSIDLDGGLAAFGFDSFRPGQREAIDTLLSVGRLLLVAPTGGGKSLIYQLPANLLPGTTLVISPLIALMNDQVSALERAGISATYLASTLPGDEIRDRMRRLAAGEYKLVYAAPERLVHPGFRSLMARIECPLIAIDEAHCISEWGHDFRPEYLAVGDVLADLKPRRVLACTATATPVVRDEIVARLGLGSDTPQLVSGFARPNLALRSEEVASRKDRHGAVDGALAEALGAPGSGSGTAIVYAPTRKSTEEEAVRLDARGWTARAYHAGLAPETREDVHRAFAEGACDIIVATNAFGMGIDRADVRAVVHLAPPSSVEAYYQEVGRAGRDGEPAIGLMLVSAGDWPLRRNLIENGGDGGPAPTEIVKHKWGLFLELMRWAEGGSCRHDAILRYFGDEAETLAGCGRCDVCESLARGDADEQFGPDTVQLIVRKALSGVARVHGRYGLSAAAKLLHGSPDPRLERSGVSKTSTHGILAEFSEDWITQLLRRCVTAGWVDFFGGDRPVVILTEEGREVMLAHVRPRIVLPPRHRRWRAPRKTDGAGAARGGAREALQSRPEDEALFDALRRHRLELAQERGVPPYVVATDRSLRDIAALRPSSLDELLEAHGVGPAKAKRDGTAWLELVARHSTATA